MSTVKKYVKTAKPYLVAYPGRDRFQPDFSLEEISRRTFEPGPLKILFVGNVIKRKGLHVLLSALAEIPNEHWQLKVIGRLDLEPDYVARIKKLIRVKGWEKSVLILGPQNESDLIQSYRGHQLLAVPSLYEAFGMVYLEALSFGLPVIASAEGGAKEIFNGTDAGMLVAPNDFPAIAKYIKRIMADRKLLLKQSINAHVRHKKFPTWSESLKDVRDFLLAFSTKKAYKHDNG